MTDPNEDWLGLSETAALLGVHPSTVRAWANQGKLPVHRTAGGHRRFLRSEIDRWSTSDRRTGTNEAQLVMENVIGRTRLEMPRLLDQEWYAKLTESQRTAYREESRRLLTQVGGLIGEPAAEQAVRLGHDYARISLEAQMSLAEAVQAFLFFRGFLLESIFKLSEVQAAQTWGPMYKQTTLFTDQVLLALIEGYHSPSTV